MEENKRVLLGMSGGTDSSVAAMRLLEAGYEVIGVTFRFYELNGSTEYLEDARNLAERLGIRHITYDAREIFSKQIIDYFVQEYLAGRTPVPCTLCNNYLKWPLPVSYTHLDVYKRQKLNRWNVSFRSFRSSAEIVALPAMILLMKMCIRDRCTSIQLHMGWKQSVFPDFRSHSCCRTNPRRQLPLPAQRCQLQSWWRQWLVHW